jgi:outer membrane cobalamin receptor
VAFTRLMFFMRLTLIAILLLLCLSNAKAQKASISGLVKDASTKEGLFGATVIIEGTKSGAGVGIDGRYKLEIPANKNLTLLFRNLGYTSKTITLKPIPEGENRILNIELEETAKQSKEVTVTATRRKDTDISLITDVKKAEMVVNGVSSEQMAKTQDRDAAQVMARVPGVTITDNRFVMIRGVNERYNTVMINDAISPGTEVDTRAFSFDLLSSSMIERMMVFKSGAASLPGEFAGGVIKIYTRNSFGEDFTNLSFSTSFRPATTLATALQSEGTSTDFLAFDNGSRSLPSDFPSSDVYQNMSNSAQLPYAKKLGNNFGTSNLKISPDFRIGFQTGKRWEIGGLKLSTVNSFNYSSTWQAQTTQRYRYASWSQEQGRSLDTLFKYQDKSLNQNVRISAISNWMLKRGKSQFELKNLFNQISDNESVVRNGRISDRGSDMFRNYSFNYLSRSLLSSQFLARHEMGENTHLEWVMAGSYTGRNQPDFRRIRTVKPESGNQNYELVPAAGAGGLGETGRFFSSLTEYSASASANFQHSFRTSWDTSLATFRCGTYNEYKSRAFDARFFAYILKNPGQNQDLLQKPLDQLFSIDNLSVQKFVLEEGTRPQDAYTAQNQLHALWSEFMLPLGKNRITIGLRPEFNLQSLQSATSMGKVAVSNPVLSPLGFLNVSHEFSKSWVMRLAYCKTVNRPEFRELAPFVYYDFNLDANFVGNPDLKVADIHNFDSRLEYYPGEGEMISLGAFYKYFINPIETKISPVGLSPQFTYSNAESASNYGVELEVKKALGKTGGSAFIDKLSLVCNASLIHSRVDLGVVGSQERIRSLQGQSPYVVNGGIYFNDEKKNLNITAMYNVFGKRIFMVGDALFPTIYEMPRHVLDLSLSKKISRKLSLRFAVNDVLNYRNRLIQDSNRDGVIGSKDELISEFRRGSYYSGTLIIGL